MDRPYARPIPNKEARVRKGFRAAVVAACVATVGLIAPQAARASTPGCSLSSHCYSILRGSGTTFYGMYGTWNRAAMGTTSSASNPQFVDSEMWFSPSSANAWVETGLARGYFSVPAATGYYAFGAYQTTGGTYHEYSFGAVSQSSGVTDEYQISRGGTTNTFRIYFDGSYKTTPSVGFWSGNTLDIGAEAATSSGTAGTFTMYPKGLNSAGSHVNLGTETPIVDSPLYGHRPGESTWTWRIP
jgi:hypothetical protein